MMNSVNCTKRSTKQKTTNISSNQVHLPRSKKMRVDASGNERCKLWLKDGNTTMLFCKDLTRNAASVLINTINTTLISLGELKLPKNRFLITK